VLVDHFIEVILVSCPEWLEENKSINTSPSALEIKVMLASNQYNPRMKYSDFIVEDSIKRKRSKKYQTHNILSNELKSKILEHFSVQNKMFCQEFTDNDAFPELESSKYVDLKELIFTNEEVMDILSGLLVRYDKRIAKLEGFINKNDGN